MKNVFINLFVVVVVVFGLVTAASAVPTLTISDGTTVQTFTDPSGVVESGVISMDAWSIVITSAETMPALGTAGTPTMDILIQASSTAGGTLYVAFSDPGFTGTGNLLETISGHVVSGAAETVGMAAYGNTANVVGTLNPNGTQANFGSLIAAIPAQSMPILATASGMLPNSSPYALTEYVTLTTGGATSTSIDASFTSSVPDGGSTITLLGSALAGLGLIGIFFKRR